MTDYKKYALEKLEEWIHDCLSSGDATPQEIYDTIKGVVKESQEYHRKNERTATELLDLLNGTSYIHFDLNNIGLGNTANSYICDSDNSSPECQGAWNSFWEDNMPVWGHSDMESLSRPEYYSHVMPSATQRDIDAMSMAAKEDKVVKWQLPIGVDELTGDCYVNFPDDLLEAANLKEGDEVYWVDNNDGSFTLKKVTKSNNE